jgi:flagellar motor switch protein FliM
LPSDDAQDAGAQADHISENFRSSKQMSPDSMTEEQIAALVEAGRAPRLRPMDFERPTKFTTDQERRLARLMEGFCRTAATRLSAELRTPVELELAGSTQLTWSAALAQVPDSAACAIVAVRPLDTRLLLTAELPLMLAALEALLGGSPQGAPAERRLTEIDWALSRRLFSTLLHQLSLLWHDAADVELEIADVESSLENVQIAALSEPTLSLAVEARIAGITAALMLHIPFAAIAPVASAFSHRDAGATAPDPDTAEAVDAALRAVEITMRAEVADTHLTVEEVLALKAGDVVRLGRRASDGVVVHADTVPVHHAKPGRSGTRRAVQVLRAASGSAR